VEWCCAGGECVCAVQYVTWAAAAVADNLFFLSLYPPPRRHLLRKKKIKIKTHPILSSAIASAVPTTPPQLTTHAQYHIIIGKPLQH